MVKQEVWDVNIFTNLSNSLKEASKEILVATAWFTDRDLFLILKDKLEEGINVQIIISENEDNKRLDFDELKSLGAVIAIVPKKGRGMMHDKFCVIDGHSVISGSYNWTHNARMNNSESVIYSHDEDTVNIFKNKFNKMMNSEQINNNEMGNGICSTNNFVSTFPNDPVPFNTNISILKTDFEKNLDFIVSTESSDFDRNALNLKGFNSAKNNNGDHKIIAETLDSIYSIFVFELDVIEDKKKKLIAKINETKIQACDLLKNKFSTQKKTAETRFIAQKEEYNRDISNIQIQIDTNYKSIKDFYDVKKLQNKKDIDYLKEEIIEHEIDYIRPSINWIDLITNSFLSLGLLIYIFVFYSSAGYILLYSVQDAKLAKLEGSSAYVAQEVFNPDAIGNALDKGFSALIFILFFVFIPVGCAIYSSLVKMEITKDKNKFFMYAKNFFKKFSLIILMDGFIAYKVAKAVYETAYLSGNKAEEWVWSNAFLSIDFYLVFILGTVALFLFEIFFSKLKNLIEIRNVDIEKGKKKLIIDQKKNRIKEINEKLNSLDIEKLELEKKNITLKNNIESFDKQLIYIPTKMESEFKLIEDNFHNEIHSIENISQAYISNIENNKFPISFNLLKDRISVFLEGWNEWLHTEFSVSKAMLLSEKSRNEAGEWKKTKMTNGLNANISNN